MHAGEKRPETSAADKGWSRRGWTGKSWGGRWVGCPELPNKGEGYTSHNDHIHKCTAILIKTTSMSVVWRLECVLSVECSSVCAEPLKDFQSVVIEVCVLVCRWVSEGRWLGVCGVHMCL